MSLAYRVANRKLYLTTKGAKDPKSKANNYLN